MTEQMDKPVPGTVCTFYSYKGGVGRSMALANVGVLLALAGKRVLLIDWDLEAPGLEEYFKRTARLIGDPLSVPGVVDLLEAKVSKKDMDWHKCCLRAEFLGKSLDIISAGSRTDDYRKRVQQLDWESLYSEHQVGNYINELRDSWRKNYDFVLVDSRTGVTDIGDICTVLLPDIIVFMFVTNYQSIEGIKSVVKRAETARKRLPVNRNKLLSIPLPARDEVYNEYDKSLEWKQKFAEEFKFLFREWLPKEVSAKDALNKLFVPYVTNWSFGERIPVLENSHETQNPSSIGAAYKRLANLLSSGLDWYSIEGKATVEEVQGAQVELLRERERAETSELKAQQIARTGRRNFFVGIVLSIVIAYTASYYTRDVTSPIAAPTPPSASTDLLDGSALLDQGKTEDAIKVFQARKALLEDRLKVSQNDVKLLKDLSDTYLYLGDAQKKLGQPVKALDAYRSSKQLLERVLVKNPGDQTASLQLASSHNMIGSALMDQSKLDEAISEYWTSKVIMEKLLRQDASNTDWLSVALGSRDGIGRILRAQGKLNEALAIFREELVVLLKLSARDQSNTQGQINLSDTYIEIGDILETQGRLDEAMTACRKGNEIVDKLIARVTSATNNAALQSTLAIAHHVCGRVLLDQNKFDEAMGEHKATIAIFGKLSELYPSWFDLQHDLALSHYWIGRTLLMRGKAEEAVKEMSMADKMLDEILRDHTDRMDAQPDMMEVLSWKAAALLASGKIEPAKTELDRGEMLFGRADKLINNQFEWQRQHARLLGVRANIMQAFGDEIGARLARQEAEKLYYRLLTSSPTNSKLKQGLADLSKGEKVSVNGSSVMK